MIVQLIVAIAGIAIAIGLNAQLDYMMTKSPGYNKENIIKVNMTVSNSRSKSKDENTKLMTMLTGN